MNENAADKVEWHRCDLGTDIGRTLVGVAIGPAYVLYQYCC